MPTICRVFGAATTVMDGSWTDPNAPMNGWPDPNGGQFTFNNGGMAKVSSDSNGVGTAQFNAQKPMAAVPMNTVAGSNIPADLML